MKKIILVLTCVLLTVSLIACEKEPLKLRNLIEADQYIRNNISQMEWAEFKLLLAEDNTISEQDFIVLQDILSAEQKSSHVEVGDLLYRFNAEHYLMYMTEWEQNNQLLYLKDVEYINNTE